MNHIYVCVSILRVFLCDSVCVRVCMLFFFCVFVCVYVCVFAWNIQHFVFARECQKRQKDAHRTLLILC
jgi:hypothetical protein